MNKEEKIQLIQEAQELLDQAIEILSGIDNPPSSLENYILPSLIIRNRRDHGFLTNDESLDHAIEEIKQGEN